MTQVILWCEENPALKLGPGSLDEAESITFLRGFARVDTEDPNYNEKMRWVNARGTPRIEVLGTDDQGIADSEEPDALVCPICQRRFKRNPVGNPMLAYHSHLRSHEPKPVTVP